MPVIRFEEIDSTSTYAKTHFESLSDLCFILASYQNAGKGRQGRSWKAEKGENLLFSLLIKNGPMLSAGPFLSLVAAVSIAETLETKFHIPASIKWPNDVYVNGKKIAGILLEGIGESCIVIGIGINVNQTVFAGDYRVPPTSLSFLLGKSIDLGDFFDAVSASLLENLARCQAKESFLSFYRNHDCLQGKTISYEGKQYIVDGVDEAFSLRLKDGDEIRYVVSGEISLL